MKVVQCDRCKEVIDGAPIHIMDTNEDMCQSCWDESPEQHERDIYKAEFDSLPTKSGPRWQLMPMGRDLTHASNLVIEECHWDDSKKCYRIKSVCRACHHSPTPEQIWLNVRACVGMPNIVKGLRIKEIAYSTFIYSRNSEGYNVVYIEFDTDAPNV